MSFYARRILPPLIDLSMRNKEATRFRARLVPNATGVTLEVGVGSGLNLPFYSERVTRLFAVDPSVELLRMAKKKSGATPFPVAFLAQSGEELPIEQESIDTVVLTYTLCSIPDPAKAMRELRRVLKPSGELLFAEHGLSRDAAVQRWQRRLNPLWRRVAGGCNLDRKIDELIASAGFQLVELKNEYAKGPKPMTYMYSGRARPIS